MVRPNALLAHDLQRHDLGMKSFEGETKDFIKSGRIKVDLGRLSQRVARTWLECRFRY
jgi:hypothetical protein